MHETKTSRYSAQREKILEYVKSSKEHPTADMVYDRIRKDFPSVSLGTIYRNLHILAEQGFIDRLTSDLGADRFDGNIGVHAHFFCDDCGKIYDIVGVSDKNLPETEHYIKKQYLMYRGICNECCKEQ